MQPNLEQLSGAGAAGAMATVFIDKLTDLYLSEIEFAMVAAGLAAIVGFVAKRVPPSRHDPLLLDELALPLGPPPAQGPAHVSAEAPKSGKPSNE